jgi:hypothetical protein
MAMVTLEQKFLTFLSKVSGAELLDNFAELPSHLGQKRADAFLFGRKMVCEVKSLQKDTSTKIEAILAPLRDRPEWPVFYGLFPVSKIISHFPEREELNKSIYSAVTSSVEDQLEKANRQLRETRRHFGLGDAHGIVTILNETVEVISPQVLADKVIRTFIKREKSGKPLECVDCVWIISETHEIVVSEELAGPLSIIIPRDCASDDKLLAERVETLTQAWITFNGLHPVRLNDQQNKLNIDAIPRSRMAPPQTKQDLWYAEYRQKPYLRVLSESQFIVHAGTAFNDVAKFLLKGSGEPRPDRQTVELRLRRFSHVLEENKHRGIDCRILFSDVRKMDM